MKPIDYDRLVFVLPSEFDENSMEYSDAIEWANLNSSAKKVLKLSLNDVYFLKDKVLNIINSENNSIIGPFEDDWIESQEVKKSILSKLKSFVEQSKSEKEIYLVNKIIQLFEMAIEMDHNIYFFF